MKKLMIAAAAAATVGGAFAAPQVYDMTITVKATECKAANKAYKNVCADDVLLYRAQTTQKFYGKFWGCDCDVIACPDATTYGKDVADVNGYIFWGAKGAFHHADMRWDILQLVGKNGTNIEGAFGLDLFTCEDGTVAADPSFALSGAGYGTALVKGCANADNYIKSMSGNVVGTYNVSALSVLSGCKYCGETADCYAWDFCDCMAADSNVSAAFGTFTLKYNASQAKAVANGKSIQQANKFKSFVTDEFKCIENGEVTPEPTPEDPAAVAKENAKKAFVEAKTNLEKAESELASAKKDLDDFGNDRTSSTKYQDLLQKATDADSARTAAADPTEVPAEVVTKKDNLNAKEAELATAEANLANAPEAEKAALEMIRDSVKDVVETAKTEYANAKRDAVAADAANAAKIVKFETADAAKIAADKALADYDDAAYVAEKAAAAEKSTAAEKAVAAAQAKYDYAMIQCAVTGADCL